MPTARRCFKAAMLLVCLVGLAGAAGAQPPAKPVSSPQQTADTTIPVRVSTRVELLSIVFQLAGNPEYNLMNAQSPYAQRAQAYFRDFAGHEVVKLARQYRKESGVSFDAVMSFAVHLKDAENGPPSPLEPKILFDFNPERLDKRWGAERAKKFLDALNRFVVDAKVEKFFADNAEFYRKSGERLSAAVNSRPYRAWLDGFFGGKPGATFLAVPGLLNGGSNYGVGVLYANGKEEIIPVIGARRFDAEGLPVFDEKDGPTIVHEFLHSYINPLVDKNAKELVPAFEKLYPLRSQMMQQQAYANAKTMAYESLVRACTVRYSVEKDDAKAAAAVLADERARGFLWVGELADLMGTYQLQRDRYKTMDEFMPEVIALMAKVAKDPQEQLKKVPKVAKVTPDVRGSGARQVDPATKEIVIEFDRPMQGGYSFVGDGKDQPKMSEKPWWSSNGTTLTLPVKLDAGKRYTLKLNSLQHHGFSSAEGYAMDAVEWTFSTKTK